LAAVVVIPARYGSTRFPAKILASETGRPLVQHVVEQVRKCRLVRDVIVATDDHRIAASLKPFETKVVMTEEGHPSGTDRIAEVAAHLEDDIIVNVQADLPLIEPEMIEEVVAPFAEDEPGSLLREPNGSGSTEPRAGAANTKGLIQT